MKNLVVVVSFFLCQLSFSQQVGIGTVTPVGGSVLDIESNDKGLLIPRVDIIDLNTIAPIIGGAPESLLVWNTNIASGVGFHFWNGTIWVPLLSGVAANNNWSITGNNNTVNGVNFIGTTNAQELDFRVNNVLRYRISQKGQLEFFDDAGVGDGRSILIGFEAGENYDPINFNAEQNVFIGYQAGKQSTSARDNVAIGARSYTNNISGNFNTSIGDETMENNTTGSNNSAFGNDALRSNTNGGDNTAVGANVLQRNLGGDRNTGIGKDALRNNRNGNDNVAIGDDALFDNNNGIRNIAVGGNSLDSVLGGDRNIGIGYDAGEDLTTGNNNTFVGNNTDTNNAGIANSTALGNGSRVGASNQVRIGNTAVNSIGGFANWTNLSDQRFKYDVSENVPGLEFINKIKPVTYKLNREKLSRFLNEEEISTNTNKTHTGFLAQQVQAVAKRLGYDFNGVYKPKNENIDHYALSYSTFVVPLVKAVQQQQSQIEEQNKKIERLEKMVTQLLESRK